MTHHVLVVVTDALLIFATTCMVVAFGYMLYGLWVLRDIGRERRAARLLDFQARHDRILRDLDRQVAKTEERLAAEADCPAHPYGPDRAIMRPEWADRCTCGGDR